MRILILVALFNLTSCSTNSIFRNIYEVEDTETELQEFLLGEGIRDPGKVCGEFVPNEKGCFYLVKSSSKTNKASRLIYTNKNEMTIVLEKFDPPINFIYLNSYTNKEINSSKALPEKSVTLPIGINSVALYYFEKSAVVFFWNGSKFDQIWIND